MPVGSGCSKGRAWPSPMSTVRGWWCTCTARGSRTATSRSRPRSSRGCAPIGARIARASGCFPHRPAAAWRTVSPTTAGPSPTAVCRVRSTAPSSRRASRSERMCTPCAAHPHTAHESSSAIIHYRHHPFHGEQVEIVRRLRRYTADCVVIKLADDVQVAVPTWMLDPLACQQLADEGRPRISVAALHDLRALLDSQPCLVTPTPATQSGQCQHAGGDDARPHRASTAAATDADVRPPRPVAEAPPSYLTPFPPASL